MAADDDAVARARQGDREAFGALVRKYQRRVYATAYHIMGNHPDADDVAQDALVRAFRGLASFDGRADFFTWLYRVTVNTALNHLRRQKRAAALWDAQARDVDPAEPGRAGVTPPEWVEVGDRLRRVLEAMAELSTSLRVTLVLATVEGMSYAQIAELLEIPEGTVAWRVNEARRKLRDRLEVPAVGKQAK